MHAQSPVAPFFFSTTVRIFNGIQRAARSTAFSVGASLRPAWARRQAERILTLPPRPRAGADLLPVAGRPVTVDSPAGPLAAWEAGPAHAPAVLLVHDWGAQGAAMGRFVAPLLDAGRRVVWFDLPGHGANGRRPVTVSDLARAIRAVAAARGPVTGAIGHGIGGSALVVALQTGLTLQRVALLAAPSRLGATVDGLVRRAGLPAELGDALRDRLEQNCPVGGRNGSAVRPDLPALVMHDVGDRRVPFDEAQHHAECLTGARFVRTFGLGHAGLTTDEGAVRTVAAFLTGTLASQPTDLPADLPSLPDPAPLY